MTEINETAESGDSGNIAEPSSYDPRALYRAKKQLEKLQESCDYFAQMVDMSDAYDFGDGPRQSGPAPGLPMPYDMQYSRSLIYPGATAFAYINEIELRQIRARTRVFGQMNPYAIGAGRNRIAYTVGSGHTYKIVPKDPDDADEQLLEDCRKVIDDFRKRNKWSKRQKETVRRLDRDGERFLRLFVDEEKGEVNVRFVEPLEVQNPLDKTSAQGCYFGIQFKQVRAADNEGSPAIYDIETPTDYYLVNIGTLGEVVGLREMVPVAEMQHLKANVDMTWPRGLPTWYALQENLNGALKTLKATGKIVEFRARIGAIRKHINGAARAIQDVLTKPRISGGQGASVDTGGNYRQASNYPYASIVDIPDSTEWSFPSDTTPVDGNVAAIQAELRAVASSLAMPEYMLTGDASNANFASTMVAEGPAVKTFEEMQADLIDADIEVLELQLKIAAKAGLIAGADGDDENEDSNTFILNLVKVEAEPPIIKSENRLQEVQADNVLFQAKVMSKETFAARNSLDYANEQDKIEVEGEAEVGYDDHAGGQFGGPGGGGGSGSGRFGDNGQQQQQYVDDKGNPVDAQGNPIPPKQDDDKEPPADDSANQEGDFQEAWSDEARAAALATRRANHPDELHASSTAHVATEHADQVRDNPDSSIRQRFEANRDAQQAHKAAAKEHEEKAKAAPPNSKEAAHHTRLAKEHKRLASEHGRIAANWKSMVRESMEEDWQLDLEDSFQEDLTAIEVPDIRQDNHWRCGAAAAMCVGRYFGVGPTTLDEWSDALGTTEAKSTAPAAIVAYLQSLGLQVGVGSNLTIEDLAASIAAGRPVICPVQDYIGQRSAKALWDYGHYLTVIDVIPGYVICQDSSIENLEREPGGDVPAGSQERSGDISAPGRVLIRVADWLKNWHDIGENGEKFVQYGISVGPKIGAFGGGVTSPPVVATATTSSSGA